MKTHESWLAELHDAGRNVPAPFLYIPVMHIADLGVSAHLLGNLIFELARDHAFGAGDQAKNLD